MEKLKIDIVKENLQQLRNESLIKVKESGIFDDFVLQNDIDDQEILSNMSKFLKVMEEMESCNGCKNIQSCKKSNKGICLSLSINDEGEIDYILKPCSLYAKTLKINNGYYARDFDENNLDYDLKDTLNPDYADSRKRLIASLKNIIKTNNSVGVYLYGSRQCGKTFIMSVFSKTLIDRNKCKVAYLDTPNRIRELNDLYFINKDAFQEELNNLINVDVLILDDFGNEYKNEIVRDNIVFPLLNERLRKHLLTCFVSSYSLNDIIKMYSLKDNKSPKATQLGEVIQLLSNEIKIESIPFRK